MKTIRTILKKTFMVLFATVIANISMAATYTAVASGNWSSGATWGGIGPGTNIAIDDVVIPSGITVTLDNNVSFSGILSSLTVDGKLNSSTGYGLTFSGGDLDGAGMLTLDYATFSSFALMDFTGDMMIKHMSSTVTNFSINGKITIVDSIEIPNGTLLLQSGSNLVMASGSKMILTDGDIDVGTGTFNGSGAYTVVYRGSARNSGTEVTGSGLMNIVLALDDSTEYYTLTNDVVLKGTLSLKNGTLELNGNDVTIMGNFSTENNSKIRGHVNSSIMIQAADNVSGVIMFKQGASDIKDFEVNISNGGMVMVGTGMTVHGMLKLTKGDLKPVNSSTVKMATNSTIAVDGGKFVSTDGMLDLTSNYNVLYTGSFKSGSPELMGTGLMDVNMNLDDSSKTVTMSGDAKVRGTLTLDKGSLNLNGHNLEITGSLITNTDGSFTGHSASHLTFNTASGPSGRIRFLNNWRMLNTISLNIADKGAVTLGTDLALENLDIQKGNLDVFNSNLSINNTGTITGATTDNHVRINGTGTVSMNVNPSSPYVMFPVGTSSGGYTPASIQLNSGTATRFYIGMSNIIMSQGTMGNDITDSNKVVKRTWHISSAGTGSLDMNLKLDWTAAAEGAGFDRTKAYISHYTNGAWDYTGNTATATSTSYGTFQVSRNNITSLSPFAVASELELGVEPVAPVVSITEMYPNPVNSELTCIINTEEAATMTVADMTGKVFYTKDIFPTGSSEKHSVDFSTLPAGVYFVNITSATNQQVVKKVIKL